MYLFRSPIRLLSTIPTLTVLVLVVFVGNAAAQDEPVVGPSGITGVEVGPSGIIGEEAAPETFEGLSITSREPFGAEGGVDVPLGGRNEPAIAVNPLDPTNIVVARLFAIRVSTDSGATFSAATPAPVPATHGRSGDPSVAFDSQGRLFWTYLGSRTDNGNLDVFISQVNPATGAILPGYPVNLTASAGFPATGALNNNDKEWLAADRFPGSLFQDSLYVVWTRFDGQGGTFVHATFSTDQGQTWSAALTLSAGGEGFVWPSHIAVAPNGDVYASYHSQPTFAGGAPDGTSGQIFVLRSTDGGVSYPQKTAAYAAGNADITFNVQTAGNSRILPQSASWTQGAAQPWVLPDPFDPNNVYVVAGDDPTNLNHGAGFDDMDVFIARSTDQGLNWSAPVQIDGGPVGTVQFFPTAAIDDLTGCIAVTWYDTRAGATNAGGNFLLDVFIRSSNDGGLTFGPEVQLNDVAFDPDLGAGARFAGPPPTLRIGEYNGVAVDDGIAHAVWTGNTATGQQILFDSASACVGIAKEVTGGPDADGDGEIDVVVEVGQLQTTEYAFTITYNNPGEPPALIVDTVPAEWVVAKIEDDDTGLPATPQNPVSFSNDFGDVVVSKSGMGAKSKSATIIDWTPPQENGSFTLTIDVETRQSPGKNNLKFAPTSCGALFLNDGAIAFETDEGGNIVLEPPITGAPVIVAGPTEPLCLAAVKNPGINPGDRGPTADTDGDTLPDFDEACVNTVKTDPCLADTDGDFVDDNLDQCQGTTQTQIDSLLVDSNGCHPDQLTP